MAPLHPKVTIVMATYNWSQVLPYSIGSALAQGFRDFELIVVGDGCTDDSEQVVSAIGDERVRWINLPATVGHQSGPNNKGVEEARGELIAYLGHDDLWMPNHLEIMVGAIEAGADLAYGITALIPPDDGWPRSDVRPRYRPGVPIAPSSVVHRRSLVLEAGGWPDFRRLAVAPEVVVWTRIHESGGLPAFVPRLTCLKFAAALRKDVYRERPSHEQATWLERISSQPDLEARLLAQLLASEAEQRDSLEQRPHRRLRSAVGRLLRKAGLRGPGPGETIRAQQRYKGLDRPGL
jgi:glycosyltransferase involved in cell wall biosynthesis